MISLRDAIPPGCCCPPTPTIPPIIPDIAIIPDIPMAFKFNSLFPNPTPMEVIAFNSAALLVLPRFKPPNPTPAPTPTLPYSPASESKLRPVASSSCMEEKIVAATSKEEEDEFRRNG